MHEDVIARMRARVEHLRKVYALAHDHRMKAIIQQVIDDGLADVRKLEADAGTSSATSPQTDRPE